MNLHYLTTLPNNSQNNIESSYLEHWYRISLNHCDDHPMMIHCHNQKLTNKSPQRPTRPDDIVQTISHSTLWLDCDLWWNFKLVGTWPTWMRIFYNLINILFTSERNSLIHNYRTIYQLSNFLTLWYVDLFQNLIRTLKVLQGFL